MAGIMSQQEMSDTIRALTAQVVQLSGSLDAANNKIAALQQTCDGAWAGLDQRVLNAETNVSKLQDNQRMSNKHTMKLVSETSGVK